MTATLWQIDLSLYSEKVRWGLAVKGVEYERRSPMPGLHRPVALAVTRGRHARLPVLRMADGRRIGDSTAILAAVEAEVPDPPLYPADPGERRRALELEDFFDEHCGPHMRRLIWQHALGDPDGVVDALLPRASATRRRIMRTMIPMAAPIVRMDYQVNDAAAADSLTALRAAMDRLESELDGGDHLVGDAFTIADLTAASLFTPLICPAEREFPPARLPDAVLAIRDELEARPGGRWIHETYRRHRPV